MIYKKVKFIGDLHCYKARKTMMTPGSVQLGDLCLLGYESDFSFPETFRNKFGKGRRFFIDGNHDFFPVLNTDSSNTQEVAENLIYIPRGYVSGQTLFIGGADSVIDKDQRTPGVDWWPEEHLSFSQFTRIMNIERPVSVIVSHDCPAFVVSKMKRHIDERSSSSRIALNHIFDKLRPSLWIFAHHHQSFDQIIRDCRFVCVNTESHVHFDVPISHDLFA